MTPIEQFKIDSTRAHIQSQQLRTIARHLRNKSDFESLSAGILHNVCEVFGVDEDDVIGKSRFQYIVQARHMYAFLCSKLIPGASLQRVGRALGDRHHTTIISSIKKCESLLIVDDSYLAKFEEVATRINEDRKKWDRAYETTNVNTDMLEVDFRLNRMKSAKHYSLKAKYSEAQQSLDAISIVKDFINILEEYDLAENNNVHSTINELNSLKKQAITKGF